MDAHLENAVGSHPFVLIDFFAVWCAPCKWVVPVLKEVDKHFAGKIKFLKIDIDEHAETARQLKILSVPTLILFHDGKEVWRMRGFDTPPQLIRTLENYLQQKTAGD